MTKEEFYKYLDEFHPDIQFNADQLAVAWQGTLKYVESLNRDQEEKEHKTSIQVSIFPSDIVGRYVIIIDDSSDSILYKKGDRTKIVRYDPIGQFNYKTEDGSWLKSHEFELLT